MNAAAESASLTLRDLGKDIVTEGRALYLAVSREDSADIVKRIASVRKLAISVERAAAELLMAVEPAAKTTEDANV